MPKYGSSLDDGLTATVASDIQLARDLHFSNGTGDDLYDSVYDSLILHERDPDDLMQIDDDEVIFGEDPLEILLALEEDDE